MLVRYCASCNLAHPINYTRAAKRNGCRKCGKGLVIVDLFALLTQMGKRMKVKQRREALDAAT